MILAGIERPRPSAAYAYGATALAVAVIFSLRLALDPLLGDRSPLILFTIAVTFAAARFGTGAGAFAAIVGVLVGAFAFMAPRGSLRVASVDEAVNIAVYLLTCLAVIVVTHQLAAARAAEAQTAATLRERERELADSRDLLRSVIDGALDPIFVKDRMGAFVLANRRMAQVFGTTPERLVGRRDRDFLPAAAADAVEATDRRVMESETAAVVEEPVPDQGEPRVFLSAKVPWRKADGEVIGLIGVARDITDRAYAEQEILRLNAELERRVEERTRELAEVNAELNAFTYTVSHDLRAPLRAMEGFARILLDDYAPALDAEGRHFARRIVVAAERMENLINDLLAYSRLTRSELSLQPVRLRELVEHAAREALGIADVVIEVGEDAPPVLAEPSVLRQVVANLFSNAQKFQPSEQRPKIRVAAEARGDMVRVAVADNGIGVAPEHREQIFRVFERLHGQENYPGTGIGLAIVRKGVERMGGSTGVEATPEGGSLFWFELPAARQGREAPDEPA